jgi:N-acetyltransferase 10
LTTRELENLLTPFDLKRLESYANNALDYHVVLDLLPTVATLYFDRRLGSDVRLSAVQSAILLGLGLQRKSIEEVEVRHFHIMTLAVLKTILHFYTIARCGYSC